MYIQTLNPNLIAQKLISSLNYLNFIMLVYFDILKYKEFIFLACKSFNFTCYSLRIQFYLTFSILSILAH